MGALQDSGSGAMARSTMAYVLAGGRGSRLMELTNRRAKPAVFFGGKTRVCAFTARSSPLPAIERHRPGVLQKERDEQRDVLRQIEIVELEARGSRRGLDLDLVLDEIAG
jgi:Nucleotidyl transferase